MNSKFVFTLVCVALFISCVEEKKTDEVDLNEINIASINKTSWMVVNLKGATTFSRNPTLHLDESGTRITGSTSCNQFFGNVEIEKNTIKVSDVGSTKMMCKDIATENLFLETLKLVTHYKFSNEELNLLSANNETLMRCNKIKETN